MEWIRKKDFKYRHLYRQNIYNFILQFKIPGLGRHRIVVGAFGIDGFEIGTEDSGKGDPALLVAAGQCDLLMTLVLSC